MRLELSAEHWELNQPFTTANGSCDHVDTLLLALGDGEFSGRGEAAGVDYHGETVDNMCAQIEAVRSIIEAGIELPEVQNLLPPGGARNALDCALWDLAAKRAGRRAWDLLGVAVRPLQTLYTIGLDRIPAMAAEATAHADFPVLKVKVGLGDPLAQLAAVHRAAPKAGLVIDANQTWTMEQLLAWTPALAALGVAMIEQPLAVGEDEALRGYASPVPLCADESCQVSADLPRLVGLHELVNIKLDKTGGLSEALRLATRAEELGLELMVGNMLGTSLAMAPAFLIAQRCRYVDLDGPLLQREDRDPPMVYRRSWLNPPPADLWG